MELNVKELKTITVLYVEDEELIRNQISNMFTNLFKDVYVAKDGFEALELYKQQKDNIDVIISDINMPNMTGLELAEELQKLCNEVPIILTTAHTDEEFLLRSFELSISKYVTKPLKIKELATVVIEVANKYKKHQKLHSANVALATHTKNTITEHEKLKVNFDNNEKELDYYKTLVNTFISYIKLDSKGVIQDVSERFLLTYNYKKEDIINKSISTFTEEDSLLQKKMLEVTKHKEPTEFKLSFNINNPTAQNLCFDNILIPRYENSSLYLSGYEIYQSISL